MQNKQLLAAATVVLLALTLAGCSDAPSHNEVRKAVEYSTISRLNAVEKAIYGKPLSAAKIAAIKANIKNIKVTACQKNKSEPNTYTCNLAVKRNDTLSASSINVQKDSGKWVLVDK
jgi:PBP1b-binding outer membrane lipoprotein LpoB